MKTMSFSRSRLLLAFVALHLSWTVIYAQQQLHIHHINIGNGDATMIGIYDIAAEKYTTKVLIDGGKSTPEKYLLPYLSAVAGAEDAPLHFKYVVLTHYHNDHYNGLFALKNGRITADSIIDPGGYDLKPVFGQNEDVGNVPTALDPRATWLAVLTTAAHHKPVPFVKGHSKVMHRYDEGAQTSIANKIVIGKVGNDKVTLQAIAGWGNTLAAHEEILPNPSPGRNNANNFTLAFLLTCGEFRYFIGGDMGGDSQAPYIDQEKAITDFFEDQFPVAYSVDNKYWAPGHICGFKANHHGSDHSNKHDFITGMFPAVAITSAGDDVGWHLPHPDFVERLRLVNPLSETHAEGGGYDRGVYFTNLYDFKDKGKTYPSLSVADEKFFNQPGISYDYGNRKSGAHDSYLIKVNASSSLRRKSSFEVGRVDIDATQHYTRLAGFNCHAIH